MKLCMHKQGSQEWFLARRGHPSASEFDKIMTPAKRKLSAQADKYIASLIGDVMSPIYPEGVENFTNRSVRWGQQCEEEARRWYRIERDTEVQQVGGCLTDDERWWCSPDGLIGSPGAWLGGLELKCPDAGTHAAYVLAGTMPIEYLHQVHGALIITGLPWWDFMSYHPGMPPLLIRVTPNDYTKDLREALEQFWPRYQGSLKRIRDNDQGNLQNLRSADHLGLDNEQQNGPF